MAPTGQPDSVLVTFDDGGPQRLTILRRPLPRGPGTVLFYRCNWCQKPCRYLYLLTLFGTKLVSDLGLRCQACARLRFGSQGQYRSAFSRLFGTRLRYPWDPPGRLGPVARAGGIPGPRPPAATDRGERTMQEMLKEMEAEAKASGVEVQVLGARGPSDFENAFAAMAKSACGCTDDVPEPDVLYESSTPR